MTHERRFATVATALSVVLVSRVIAQEATPPAPPNPPAPPAAEAQAAPAPALSEEASAALKQAKDEFKKGAWADARRIARSWTRKSWENFS